MMQKKIILSVLVILCLTGCEARLRHSAEVPIVLTADIYTPASEHVRGVIETGTKFVASIAGWETSGVVDYLLPKRWASRTAIVANETSEAVILTPTQVYNINGKIKTYMKSWYPAADPEKGEAWFDNPDGTVDAMFSSEVVGSKDDNQNKVLEFSHKTTQLKFVVVADESVLSEIRLKRILLKDVQIPVGFDIVRSAAKPSEPKPLDIPGLAADRVELKGKSVGKPVMIMPREGSTLYLDVETEKDYFENVLVTIRDENFVESKAYTITLTFKQKAIGTSITVSEWEAGTGNGTLG